MGINYPMVGAEIEEAAAERGLLCPRCFLDHGLAQMAWAEASGRQACPNCAASDVPLLGRSLLRWLAQRFFVHGSLHRTDYGGAPVIQFNESQSGSLDIEGDLKHDVDLLQRTLGIGFFYYGPRLWMVGFIEPLEALCDEARRDEVVERILREYPVIELQPDQYFYRVRKAPAQPEAPSEYDAPPEAFAGRGRVDAAGAPVLYGSQDLEVCVHECRFAAEDDLFVATLAPTRTLRLLDLSAILEEKDTEFESLDHAIHMLFLAGSHSYPAIRAIAKAARSQGFDGLAYPSFFSSLRTGTIPFEAAYGISLRQFEEAHDYERAKVITNLALFGHPLAAGHVRIIGINRLRINQVHYGFSFGPVGI